jgi:hypothetical protein
MLRNILSMFSCPAGDKGGEEEGSSNAGESAAHAEAREALEAVLAAALATLELAAEASPAQVGAPASCWDSPAWRAGPCCSDWSLQADNPELVFL